MPSRLKSLELTGYKTFASKTTFDFADTITAIVGPNGSGKSNIADALRWVLGEQSFGLLRGRKTDDMIFSGSERRARAGMASATVIFDNDDGWLPIDFSEVSITRRAHRDGQNEYLINDQKVRLRDVTELLSNSGLAERTYTVIGQGLVDAALSLKADERRRLFEEAAGIGLYRARKEQTQRRLDTTRRNLDRVEDILAELKPRLRSLERQAQRAQEYEQVRADLREILREWYGYHWHRSQKELAETRRLAEKQKRQLDERRASQEKLAGELAGTRAKIQEIRSQLNARHNRLSELHSRRETISRDLAVGDERQRALIEQKLRLGDELSVAQEDLGRQGALSREAQIEVDQLKGELQQSLTQAEEVRRSLEERENQRNAGEQAVERTRRSITETNNRLVELRARKSYLESQLNQPDNDRAGETQTQAALKAGVEEAEARAKQAEKTLAASQDSISGLKDELKKLKVSLDGLGDERQQLQESLNANRAEGARIEAQMQVLAQAEKALVGYASGAKALMEAARQNRLRGLKGALHSLLEVPPEYEVAISAALGDYVDAVLLGQGEDADDALALLEAESGRAALLPLDNLMAPGRIAAPADESCLGLAADLVSAPPELLPVLDLLLGDVLVVRDRKAARRILAGQNGRTRAVTLRGEVFYQSGAILVDSRNGGGGLLGRPRERRDLENAYATAQEKIAQDEKSLAGSEERKKKLDAQMQALEERITAAGEEASGFEQAHRDTLLALDQARQRQEWERQQSERLLASRQHAAEEIAAIESDQARLREELAGAEASLQKSTADLESLSLVEAQADAAQWETKLAVAQRALADAEARLAERQAAHERIEAQHGELQARFEAVEQQLGDLQGTIGAARGSEGDLGREIAELSSLIEPDEKELHAAELEHDRLLEEEAAARQTLSVAERHYNQAQLAFGRSQESLDTLRGRIEDDFGLVEFDYDDSVSGPTPLPLGALVERLPHVAELSPETEGNLKRQRAQLRRMGSINPEAQKEYEEVTERFAFLSVQVEDLTKAEADMRAVIAELDELMEREFRVTFERVAVEFRDIFTRLFGGGTAKLVLTDSGDMAEAGIDIEARLPGKRAQRLALLSGGERSLTAAALVFALLKASPTPFCVMDEVDAMLDEANVSRFRDLLTELSRQTQFVVITHNRSTVQAADVIYGITMGRDTSSQTISLKLDEVDERYSE